MEQLIQFCLSIERAIAVSTARRSGGKPLEQRLTRQTSLIDRLNFIRDSRLADCKATSRTANRNTEPFELTFAQFVGQVRRRSERAVRSGGRPRRRHWDSSAAPLAETSYPTMIAAMVSATVAPLNYLLEAQALVRMIKAAGANVLLIDRSFSDGDEIVAKFAQIYNALPHRRCRASGRARKSTARQTSKPSRRGGLRPSGTPRRATALQIMPWRCFIPAARAADQSSCRIPRRCTAQ